MVNLDAACFISTFKEECDLHHLPEKDPREGDIESEVIR
jgi:hypothetical protein